MWTGESMLTAAVDARAVAVGVPAELECVVVDNGTEAGTRAAAGPAVSLVRDE